jgi:peroxiredoxin (alkyl hydroperoxide reductase subunit C)
MLTIGDKFPAFTLKSCVSTENGKEFETISNNTYAGKWQTIFFWPLDFTFVCPTEIIEFGDKESVFQKLNCQVLGGSTDSEFSHLAWRRENAELSKLPFPMLADVKRDLSQALGILHKDAGICLRATYIVDPSGTIRWASVNDLDVGRNVDEVVRVLEALQTEKLTPCGWKPGQKTLN